MGLICRAQSVGRTAELGFIEDSWRAAVSKRKFMIKNRQVKTKGTEKPGQNQIAQKHACRVSTFS